MCRRANNDEQLLSLFQYIQCLCRYHFRSSVCSELLLRTKRSRYAGRVRGVAYSNRYADLHIAVIRSGGIATALQT
jgi:hypothetical protein